MRQIESIKNAQVRRMMAIRQPAKARGEDVFCVEGSRAVAELCRPWSVESLWMSDTFIQRNPEYRSRLQSANPEVWRNVLEYQVPDGIFARMAETMNPQGVIAVVHRHHYDNKALTAANPLWIVLENLQDPGNAGTILRTADACGAAGILSTRGTVDFYNSKVIRSAMGSLLHIPFITMNTVSEIANFIKEQGGSLIGTHLKATSLHYEADYTGPTAILIGNEGVGMTEEAASLCTRLVKIPMPGRAESLNAGVAAAVMMYEAVRQRMYL